MKEDYLDDLYGWITSQDETYSNTYDLEGFKAKMQDTEYSSRMYDWINSIDDTFKDSHTLESFQDRVKKKDASQPTLEEEVTESVTSEETEPIGLSDVLGQEDPNVTQSSKDFITPEPEFEFISDPKELEGVDKSFDEIVNKDKNR